MKQQSQKQINIYNIFQWSFQNSSESDSWWAILASLLIDAQSGPVKKKKKKQYLGQLIFYIIVKCASNNVDKVQWLELVLPSGACWDPPEAGDGNKHDDMHCTGADEADNDKHCLLSSEDQRATQFMTPLL